MGKAPGEGLCRPTWQGAAYWGPTWDLGRGRMRTSDHSLSTGFVWVLLHVHLGGGCYEKDARTKSCYCGSP